MPGGASLTGPTILMTTTTTFSFTHRPIVPFSHDYAHGDSEPWHQHDCAQLLHSLTGVVRVDTASGCWVVPPGRGVWLPAGTQHALRITGNVAARTLFTPWELATGIMTALVGAPIFIFMAARMFK